MADKLEIPSGDLSELMRTVPGQSCARCLYGRGRLSHPELDENQRVCIRNPPQRTAFLAPGPRGHPTLAFNAGWPIVPANSYCGEWKPVTDQTSVGKPS